MFSYPNKMIFALIYTAIDANYVHFLLFSLNLILFFKLISLGYVEKLKSRTRIVDRTIYRFEKGIPYSKGNLLKKKMNIYIFFFSQNYIIDKQIRQRSMVRSKLKKNKNPNRLFP